MSTGDLIIAIFADYCVAFLDFIIRGS